MDALIVDYLNANSVFSLSTSNNGEPHSAICFYAFESANKQIVFLSSSSTRHIIEGLKNDKVSGAVFNQETSISKIQGVQFSGDFSKVNKTDYTKFRSIYLKKFPMARFLNSELWKIQLTHVKMTNNSMGFGKKIIWERLQT